MPGSLLMFPMVVVNFLLLLFRFPFDFGHKKSREP
jgi:hypothetical protein